MKNYWWLNINPRILRFRDFDNEDFFTYSAFNEDGSKRKVFSNFEEAKIGDEVLIYETYPVGRLIGICIISGALDNGYICLQKKEQFTEPINRTAIEENREIVNIEAFRNQEGIFFKLFESEYHSLYTIIREYNPTRTLMQTDNYNKEDFLKEVYFSSEEYDELKSLIETRKNVILQGPPGTGKTYIAKKMAYAILGKKDSTKILSVQFHPNYSCDEFIEGFRPDDIGIYKYRQGCFKLFCNKARNDKLNKYFLIIDEINRGDIIKIFGDTFMLLEPDKRGKENYVELPACKERFYIPENLYIIGTMNIADNENTMNDYAVRRRFCFYNINLIFENKRFIEECMNNSLVKKIVEKVLEINEMLDDNKKIGHCYFCNVKNNEDFIRTVKYMLIPLIEEYFKEDKKLKDKAMKMILDVIK